MQVYVWPGSEASGLSRQVVSLLLGLSGCTFVLSGILFACSDSVDPGPFQLVHILWLVFGQGKVCKRFCKSYRIWW